jgi:hypothetical protein
MCGCRLVSASVYFSVKFHYYKVVRGVHTFQKEISREPLINLILYIYIYIYIEAKTMSPYGAILYQ